MRRLRGARHALAALAALAARAAATRARAVDAPDAAADSLTVEQCVGLARQRAPAVAAAELDRRAAAGDSAALASNRRPEFALTAGATVAPEGFYDPVITNLGEYELKAGLDWTLADGGRRARARQRGGLDLAAARWRLATESRDAGLAAAALAIHLLRLQEAAAAQRDAIDWLDRLGTLVRSGVASGVRAATDSLRVALERDGAAATLESTRLDTRTTALELGRLLGREDGPAPGIRAPTAEVERGPAAEDSLRLLASVARQPEVALAQVAEAQGRLDALDAHHGAAPTVEVALDAGLAGSDLTRAVPLDLLASDPQATFADRLHRDLGASAAVRLRLPLLDRSVRPASGAREDAVRAATTRRRGEEDAQRRRALALLETWRSAARRVEAARATHARAERNVLMVKSVYAAGATTLLDLLDARRVLDDARERLADARQDERLARFQVEDRR